MTKDAYYFRHDTNASNDPKMIALRSVYGWQGVGWYWRIIEHLREQNQYRVTITDQYCYKVLAKLLDTTRNKAETFIKACIDEFQLFKSDGQFFWSERLLRDMEKLDDKRKKAQASAKERWEKPTQSERKANAMPTQCEGNAIKPNLIKSNLKEPPTPTHLTEKPEQRLAGKVLTAEQVDYFLKTYPKIDLEYHLGKMEKEMELKGEPIKKHYSLLKYRLEHLDFEYKKLTQPQEVLSALRTGERIDPDRQPKTCTNTKCGKLANPIINKDGEKYYLCSHCDNQFNPDSE